MDDFTLRERIWQEALPLTEKRTVTDVVVGISMLAVELDKEVLSVAYVLRDDLPSGCSVFPVVEKMIGMSAKDASRLFVDGDNSLLRALGAATINAAASDLELIDTEHEGKPFDIALSPADTVGMAGMIRPAAREMRKSNCRMIIFDKGKCSHGAVDDDLFPMEMQEELLPKCTVLASSGTAVINGTICSLFEMAPNARDTVLIGASVPMIPAAWRDTPVTVLAGSMWREDDKDEIFRLISRACGMKSLSRFMIKKNVRIKDSLVR